jgi:hypothetical protein
MDGTERVELLGARSPNGHALVYWWKPSRDWQAIDLTEITGREIASPPEAWVTSAGNGRLSEHLAAVGTDGWLRVFYSFDQPRTLTDKVGEAYQGIKRMRNTTRKVVAILWDPHYPGIAKPDRAVVVNALFGATNSVRDYFRENSAGAFSIRSAGVLGWYDADRPLNYYDNPDNPHDKAGAALRAADPDFDFSAYDDDDDGTLEPHELAIVFIHPGRADETLAHDTDEVELSVETAEEVIAPRGIVVQYANHNEAFVSDTDGIDLSAEELEEMIAPRGVISSYNHNETLISDTDEIELDVEAVEEVIALGVRLNHSETLISDEIELSAEEVEEVVAPGIGTSPGFWSNHNETLVSDEVELSAEEVEEVIAPRGIILTSNHNETFVSDEIELCFEEVEDVIAPKGVIAGFVNHNETLVSDEIELSVEEVEEVIAPKGIITPYANHNETLVSDAGEIEIDVEELEEMIAPKGVVLGS